MSDKCQNGLLQWFWLVVINFELELIVVFLENKHLQILKNFIMFADYVLFLETQSIDLTLHAGYSLIIGITGLQILFEILAARIQMLVDCLSFSCVRQFIYGQL